MPVLYLVGTPIGNLEDITLRALRVLQEVALVAAEDTRKARVLFGRYDIKTPLTSYHEQGQRSKAPSLARQLAERDIALISEAGMPSVSDPGYALVRAALEQGFRVEVIPGPSAVTAALAVSGLPSDQFLFLGFLPRTARQRRRSLTSARQEPRTLIALEAPHRLAASLEDIAAILGDRPMAVCRELTKLHEEVFRGTAREAAEHFRQPRGEFTLIIGGSEGRREAVPDTEVTARLLGLKAAGMRGKEAIAQVVGETGRARREVYRLWVQLGKENDVSP